MSFFKKAVLGSAVTAAMGLASTAASADVLKELMKDSTVYGNVNIRSESFDVDGGASGSAITMRTWLGFKSGSYNGFSTHVEFEDVRPVFGNDEVGNGIADPDQALTELDQAYVQYKNDSLTTKVGRQVITLDNHRHVGHVAWRQDKQTFDAARVIYTPAKDLKIDYSYVYKVNRINSKIDESPTGFPSPKVDFNLLNVSYKTPIGKVAGYYYDLSEESHLYKDTTTTGAYIDGSTGGDVKFLYKAEYATQDNDSLGATTEYKLLEGGIKAGGVTAKLSWENVGSDTTAAGGQTNFTTPLSTIHAFQGWADVFLLGGLTGGIDGGNGIEDLYLTVSGKVSGVKLVGVYHDYESSKGARDLGSEYNLLAVKPINKTYTVGFKYADYSGTTESGNSDKEVVWAWLNAKF
jgi:hypothetical protein